MSDPTPADPPPWSPARKLFTLAALAVASWAMVIGCGYLLWLAVTA